MRGSGSENGKGKGNGRETETAPQPQVNTTSECCNPAASHRSQQGALALPWSTRCLVKGWGYSYSSLTWEVIRWMDNHGINWEPVSLADFLWLFLFESSRTSYTCSPTCNVRPVNEIALLCALGVSQLSVNHRP